MSDEQKPRDNDRTRLIRRLHAAAVEACEQNGVDLDPHQVARDAARVASLRDATEPQLRAAIRRLASGSVRTPEPGTRNPRKRPARPGGEGVIKLPTPAQLALITRLLERLGWTYQSADRVLGGHWSRISGNDGVRWERLGDAMTAKDASDAINTLIGECKRLRM